jgi:hypothetical protein
MTAAEAMQAIEGDRFAALTNLASNLKTFLRIAAAQPEVEALSRALANNPAVASQVLHRALALLTVAADADCEHGADAALATYLWVLSDQPQEVAQVAAGVLREQRHFFWARKVAQRAPTANGPTNGDGTAAKGQATGEVTEETRASQPRA